MADICINIGSIILDRSITNASREKSSALISLILQSAVVVGGTIVLIASLTIHQLRHWTIWYLPLWRWWLLIFSAVCGGIIAEWTIKLVVHFTVRLRRIRMVTVYLLLQLRLCVALLMWLGMVCLAWYYLFDFDVERTNGATEVAQRITRGIVGCVICAAMWVVKTFLVELVGSSYVLKLFKESVRRLDILMHLSKQIKAEKNSTNSIDYTTLKRLLAWAHDKKFIDLSYFRYDPDKNDYVEETIKDEEGARNAAKEIFERLVSTSANKQYEEYLDKDEVFQYVADERVRKHFEDIAQDVSGKKCIRKLYFEEWAVHFHLRHKRVSPSFMKSNLAVDELHRLASVIVLIMMIIVWLLFMGFLSTKVLLFISSQLLVLTFMFGNTFKTVFESAVFVFGVQPYNIGDRVLIDQQQLTVVEMNLLTTNFRKSIDEHTRYPNSVLSSKEISRWRYPKYEILEFMTCSPISSVTAEEIRTQVPRKINIDEWYPNHKVEFEPDKEHPNQCKMILHVRHVASVYQYDKRSQRKSSLMVSIRELLEEVVPQTCKRKRKTTVRLKKRLMKN